MPGTRDGRPGARPRLLIHAALEAAAFYPFLRKATGRPDALAEADVEHEVARHLIDELRGERPALPRTT